MKNMNTCNAAHVVVKIIYPGVSNNSQFVYDAAGGRSKIIETVNNLVTSTRQFWSAEERDGNGNVTKQFYARGEIIGGNTYFYTRDHISSIRELTDSASNTVAQYEYDPFGQKSKVQGSLDSDIQFAGYFTHSPSALLLTLTREYSANLGRFLNRDSLQEVGAINLYSYVGGNPISLTDSTGMKKEFDHSYEAAVDTLKWSIGPSLADGLERCGLVIKCKNGNKYSITGPHKGMNLDDSHSTCDIGEPPGGTDDKDVIGDYHTHCKSRQVQQKGSTPVGKAESRPADPNMFSGISMNLLVDADYDNSDVANYFRAAKHYHHRWFGWLMGPAKHAIQFDTANPYNKNLEPGPPAP